MLFDLRGRGRRRTVRVVYSGLALLFLLGFVGFGVGGGFGGSGGGLFESVFGGNENGSGPNYEAQVKAAKKVTVEQPNNPAAWSKLIHELLLQAGSGENYNSTENVFTAKAQPLLAQVGIAWQRYLKLETHHPNPEIAAEVLRMYTSPGGINEPAQAVKAMKIEISSRPPSATLYYDLALLAYQANNKKEGDRAAKKAIALAPASQKKLFESYLAKAKAGPTTTATTSGSATGTATGGAATTGAATTGTATVTTATLTTGTIKGKVTPPPAQGKKK
jgi:hypothetical protein